MGRAKVRTRRIAKVNSVGKSESEGSSAQGGIRQGLWWTGRWMNLAMGRLEQVSDGENLSGRAMGRGWAKDIERWMNSVMG